MSGQLWSLNRGYYNSVNLSKEFRKVVNPETKFRQFCDVKDKGLGGKGKGDIYHWNVYGHVATQGSTVGETTRAPETSFPIYQGTLTVTEAINSVPYSGKYDDLSGPSVREIINNALKDDAAKFFDISAHAQFDETPLRVYPSTATSTNSVSLSTTGTVGGTASVALQRGHVEAIVDLMRERNIPAYEGGDYYSISWPTTLRPLKRSLEAVYQYTQEGFKMVRAGEVGRYNNVRFIEHTHAGVPKDGTTYTDWAYFFGKDTVAEAIVCPEEIRGKVPDDYGRSQGIAWYYLGGFGLCHTSAMSIADIRIVKWESLA
jgi:hypothetical protein